MKQQCVYCEDGTVVDVLYLSDHPSNKIDDGVHRTGECTKEDIEIYFYKLNATHHKYIKHENRGN